MKLLLANAWKPVFAQIDLKDATISLVDGTATPVELIIKIGEGNLTWSERRNIEYTLDRGTLDEVREGDQIPVEVRLDIVWEYLTGGSATAAVGTPKDFLKKQGVYASNTSTDTDTCRPYAVSIEVEYVPSCSGVALPNERVLLVDFRWETIDHDLRAGTLSVTGQCNVTEATVTRYSS